MEKVREISKVLRSSELLFGSSFTPVPSNRGETSERLTPRTSLPGRVPVCQLHIHPELGKKGGVVGRDWFTNNTWTSRESE